MKAIICPRCKTNLVLFVDQEIEIDQCPACKGVWLDHGEYDKLIERSNNGSFQNNNSLPIDNQEHHSEKKDYDEYESEHDNRFGYGSAGYGNQFRKRKNHYFDLKDF
jgi:Zn-finger nucleic acid-binding protein